MGEPVAPEGSAPACDLSGAASRQLRISSTSGLRGGGGGGAPTNRPSKSFFFYLSNIARQQPPPLDTNSPFNPTSFPLHFIIKISYHNIPFILSFPTPPRTPCRSPAIAGDHFRTAQNQVVAWGVSAAGAHSGTPPPQPLQPPPGSAAHVPEPRGRAGTALTRLLQVARAGRDARTAAADRAARRYDPRAPPPKADPGRAQACPALRACVGNMLTCWVQVGRRV